MLDIKKEISEQIAKTIENVKSKEIYTYIEVPKRHKKWRLCISMLQTSKNTKKITTRNSKSDKRKARRKWNIKFRNNKKSRNSRRILEFLYFFKNIYKRSFRTNIK